MPKSTENEIVIDMNEHMRDGMRLVLASVFEKLPDDVPIFQVFDGSADVNFDNQDSAFQAMQYLTIGDIDIEGLRNGHSKRKTAKKKAAKKKAAKKKAPSGRRRGRPPKNPLRAAKESAVEILGEKDGLTTDQIAEIISADRNEMSKAMAELHREGVVTSVTKAGKNCYTLKDDENEE